MQKQIGQKYDLGGFFRPRRECRGCAGMHRQAFGNLGKRQLLCKGKTQGRQDSWGADRKKALDKENDAAHQ